MPDTDIMTFAVTFRELRKRRRLPMTTWEPKISSPYVNDVEKKGLLPGEDKLEVLVKVFVDVAREQGAADPEDDARQLRQAREKSFLTQRAKLDPELVEIYMCTRQVVGQSAVRRERKEMVDALKGTVQALGALTADDRDKFLMDLQKIVAKFRVAAGASLSTD